MWCSDSLSCAVSLCQTVDAIRCNDWFDSIVLFRFVVCVIYDIAHMFSCRVNVSTFKTAALLKPYTIESQKSSATQLIVTPNLI
jgi:hypothetical protein